MVFHQGVKSVCWILVKEKLVVYRYYGTYSVYPYTTLLVEYGVPLRQSQGYSGRPPDLALYVP
jgi:hypothetical protein